MKASLVTDAFNKTGTAKIIQSACAQEKHEDGNVHYHIVVKLYTMKRWKAVGNYLSTKYQIKVSFTNEISNFFGHPKCRPMFFSPLLTPLLSPLVCHKKLRKCPTSVFYNNRFLS